MRKKTAFICSIIIVLSFFYSVAYSATEEFPGRTHKKYKLIPYIELEDLYDRLNKVIVVDARSRLEYETLRIKGAVNYSVSGKSFENNIIKLREKTNKPIVFYCNGHTCMKSYKAAKKALAVGVKDVFAYDAGIFEWSQKHPEESVLLGKNPINVKDIISKNKYKAHLLDPDTFSERATKKRESVLVIDIRDMYQRAAVGFFPGQERWASLHDMKKVKKYVSKAKAKNRTLFIYDEVGKQVRWLQYTLEGMGVKKYYFMEKGAAAYYKMLAKSDSAKTAKGAGAR